MSKVKEFVGIARELLSEVDKEINGECPESARVPWEVIGAWASTIFINQNNKSSAPKEPPSETKEVIGRLEAKGKKTVNGKDLRHVKINGQFYNTFNKDVFGGLEFNVGETVKAKVKQNSKGYWNLIELTPLEDQASEDIDF